MTRFLGAILLVAFLFLSAWLFLVMP